MSFLLSSKFTASAIPSLNDKNWLIRSPYPYRPIWSRVTAFLPSSFKVSDTTDAPSKIEIFEVIKTSNLDATSKSKYKWG